MANPKLLLLMISLVCNSYAFAAHEKGGVVEESTQVSSWAMCGLSTDVHESSK